MQIYLILLCFVRTLIGFRVGQVNRMSRSEGLGRGNSKKIRQSQLSILNHSSIDYLNANRYSLLISKRVLRRKWTKRKRLPGVLYSILCKVHPTCVAFIFSVLVGLKEEPWINVKLRTFVEKKHFYVSLKRTVNNRIPLVFI